jgi:ATP-binding cassette subfamily C protein CydC
VVETAEETVATAEPPPPRHPPRGHALRFEAVSFRWQEDRRPVFDGLSLELPEGAHAALLGPSGAGKSTLAALALKVARPASGRVLLGDADYATLPAAEIRRHIAWLGQTTHLFDDTIGANLRLARPDADEAALWAALAAARIADSVAALPDRLDTWVGEGGTRFSGGQGRRLALARALLSPAPILILDEPCAGLDAATERAFLATLNEAAAGRSVLLITHRLIGVERLDRIWRLAGGKAIAAAG